MLDDLLLLPDIWYCLSWRQSAGVFFLPGSSLPTASCSLIFSASDGGPWRIVSKKKLLHLSDQTWYQWLKRPIRQAIYRPVALGLNPNTNQPHKPPTLLNGQACFTCSECSGCCPIICDGDVFDPQRIIRLANLGLSGELLKSPVIWLCLGCQRFTDACSQTASGHDIIRQLQRQAIATGIVDPHLPIRLLDADRIIYPNCLDEIDTLIGLYRIKP